MLNFRNIILSAQIYLCVDGWTEEIEWNKRIHVNYFYWPSNRRIYVICKIPLQTKIVFFWLHSCIFKKKRQLELQTNLHILQVKQKGMGYWTKDNIGPRILSTCSVIHWIKIVRISLGGIINLESFGLSLRIYF